MKYFFFSLFLSVNPLVIIFFLLPSGITDERFTDRDFPSVISLQRNGSANTDGKSEQKKNFIPSVIPSETNRM